MVRVRVLLASNAVGRLPIVAGPGVAHNGRFLDWNNVQIAIRLLIGGSNLLVAALRSLLGSVLRAILV